MSYARVGSSGCYIYLDCNGNFSFDSVEVPECTIDIFLYKIATSRPEELQERIQRGKELCDKWVKSINDLEERASSVDEFPQLWRENESTENDSIPTFETSYVDEEELIPCPFCGGEPWLEQTEYSSGDTWYSPQCSNCKCMWGESYETKEEAVFVWNERVYDS